MQQGNSDLLLATAEALALAIDAKDQTAQSHIRRVRVYAVGVARALGMSDDEVLAFRTLCPHRGCHVRAVAAGTINCFCHGSRFRIGDGSVVGGPAPGPLTPVAVVVADGMVALADAAG